MGKAAREASRERLRQEREQAKKRAARNRVLGVVGAALAVVLVVVGGGYLFFAQQSAQEQAFADRYEQLPAQTLQEDGSVVLAKEGVKAPVVEVYADFQCPACKQFETASGPTLQQLASEGKAIVHYRPVSIFAQAQEPLSANSLRAAAAARAAADHGKFVQYNDLLFENQPPEGTQGFATGDLKEWGGEVGIDDPAFAQRVEAESKVVDTFTGEYLPRLTSAAQQELSGAEIKEMGLSGLMEWGDDNGVDSSFLQDTYVQEVIDATGAVKDRYSSGANAFNGTPSVYVNGGKMGDAAFSGDGVRDAVERAEPGKVSTEPLAAGAGATADASPEPDVSP
ncbi:thioredoxin domain-containing protein [Streptomonospora sp. PA3]|uniref:DsbA family protein n=1 Tax=Streptomonospora sp. PA3 TaxID=2607326 RepID=UPI0012DDA2A4|nr:thioredoxin domain-containing protein [Streptomonospora sp. PA3]MUL40785.1 thioredoxin domain-containing protein [Streptomonospora sp. PA3]